MFDCVRRCNVRMTSVCYIELKFENKVLWLKNTAFRRTMKLLYCLKLSGVNEVLLIVCWNELFHEH